MNINHTTLQRLAFVKYLFSLAVEQSRAPEILASASLLTFHDSIELFLQISSEHLNIRSDKNNFMDYWDPLSKKIKASEIPQKEAMRRLNKARVALKHHGILPSKLDIESFRVATDQFFQESINLIYGIEFENISLVEYVSPEESREHLKNAEKLASRSEYIEATSEIALAFEKMISYYESDKKNLRRNSPFFFGQDMTFQSAFHLGIDRAEFTDIANFVDNVKESIDSMQKAIKILALGLDYRKYSKFTQKLPYVTLMASGEYRVFERTVELDVAPNEEYIKFCINFVIECAIKVNEFDYMID